jgi:hypothetical protein
MSRPHVLYLGDWVFHVGPVFIETPFALETKDCDLHFYGQRLADALGKEADLTTLANWQLYRLPPGKLEEHVGRSAAVIISDVEAKCFHLYPSFFDRARREQQVVTFPDRLESINKEIRARRRGAHDARGLAIVLGRPRDGRLAAQHARGGAAGAVPGRRGPRRVVGGLYGGGGAAETPARVGPSVGVVPADLRVQ